LSLALIFILFRLLAPSPQRLLGESAFGGRRRQSPARAQVNEGSPRGYQLFCEGG